MGAPALPIDLKSDLNQAAPIGFHFSIKFGESPFLLVIRALELLLNQGAFVRSQSFDPVKREESNGTGMRYDFGFNRKCVGNVEGCHKNAVLFQVFIPLTANSDMLLGVISATQRRR